MKIVFDMDGTIADLYAVPDWLSKIENSNPIPYLEAKPMWDMRKLAHICQICRTLGIEIHIVTWLSMDSTKEYERLTAIAKLAWLKKYGFPYDFFHPIAYGISKSAVIKPLLAKNETAILFDDNAKVREDWKIGRTIDPTACDIIKVLESLI